jgi:hypothetical protein
MSLADEDLMMLLRNYGRLEQAGSRMFRRWSEEATDSEMKATLAEFSEIEHQQANAIVLHLAKLEGKMSDGPAPLEEAINLYLDQIDVLPTLGERLRFNHTVMTTLERPVVMRALVEAKSQETKDLFEKILDNEDRILTWCDATATRLGIDHVDVEKYFAGVTA